MKIINGVYKGNLSIDKDNLKEFISRLNEIKQIDGDLSMCNLNLIELPNMSNIIINGTFYCYCNELTSLKGCPKEINDIFSCFDNKLTTLEYFPEIIKGRVFIDKNVPLSEKVLNIIKKFSELKSHLNEEDKIQYLRELKLVKILHSHEVSK